MQELLGPAAEPAGGGRAWLQCSQHDKRRRCGGPGGSCCGAGLLGVPVGGGPPASRPRRELRSARRLEARPGPAAAHGHRSQALCLAARPCAPAPGTPAAPQATTAGKLPTGRHTVFVLISYLVPLFFPSRSITKGKTRDSLKQRPSPTMGTFRCKRKENPGTWAGSGVRWRRMGDSNPRGLAPNTLSKRAP